MTPYARIAAMTPIALTAVILAGCGGKSAADSTQQSFDKSYVQDSLGKLELADANGGNVNARAVQLASDIRTASADGVPADWLGAQIDEAESQVTDCSDCTTLLENVRP